MTAARAGEHTVFSLSLTPAAAAVAGCTQGVEKASCLTLLSLRFWHMLLFLLLLWSAACRAIPTRRCLCRA
jgi:hypothetical protein